MSRLQGELVEVEFVPDDQFAHLAGPLVATDAPGLPTSLVEEAEAVRLVKAEQKAPGKAGPITLRGRWTGTLICDGGVPRVELRRKLATYGMLHVESVAGEGWTWRVERTEKWFSEPGRDEGSAPTLLSAIQEGLKGAMGMLSEACSHRDSHRRAAYDTSWAERHPIRPAREGRNPTERLKVKEGRRRRSRSAAVPAPPDASGLRERTAEEASAFEADPKATTAKAWVRAALRALDVVPEKLTGKSRTGEGGREVVVTVVLPGSEDGEEARRRLAEAAPEGLVVGGPSEAAQARSLKKRAPRTQAETEEQPAVNETKDNALLHAFTAAIGAVMAERRDEEERLI